MTKVKVGSVTNLSEARYCAGMGVDFLSFPISSVNPKMFQEITGWISGPKFGIKVDSDSVELASEYKIDFIEVSADSINDFVNTERIIVCVAVNEWPKNKSNLLSKKEKIIFIEVEVNLPLVSSTLNTIEEVAQDFEVLLKCIDSIDPTQILKLPIAGISLDGNPESKPGLKEYPLSEILESLEVID